MARISKKAQAQIDAQANDEINQAMEIMVLENLPAEETTMAMAENLTSEADEALDILEATETTEANPFAEAPLLPKETVGETDVKTFDQIVAALDPDAVKAQLVAIVGEMDERADFEKAKNGDNKNIQNTIKSARAVLCMPSAAAVLLASAVSPSELNRSKHEGTRYNVYAYGKLADIVRALNGGQVGNAINNAIIRSMFALKKGGHPFTSELAKCAASQNIRNASPAANLLVRHTVAPSTASTQASSTLQALETLGIVKRVGGAKHSTWELTDVPAVAKLASVMGVAA